MKKLPYLFILLALTIMSCKSGEEAANGKDSVTNTDLSAETEAKSNNGTNAEDGSSDFDDQVTDRKKMTKDLLVGEWVWVQTSCCGRMTKDIFPEPDAEKRIISFDEEGMAKYYTAEKGKKLEEQPFTISKLGTQATVKIGELTPAIFLVNGDELMLSWGYIDLQIEYYQRVKKEEK